MRRKRAIILFACQSFAWFTSKDEVTNRLTANSDYGVSIVESFAPPENWIPGQTIDKDVYAVNTGNIDAFVKTDVSGVLNYTYEKLVSTFDETNGVVLNDAEVAGIEGATTMEAGSFLAWTNTAEPLGNKVINYDGTAWKPTTEGIYIFRRAIDTSTSPATPAFKYSGYYYKNGKYYKIVIGKDTHPYDTNHQFDVSSATLGDNVTIDKDGKVTDGVPVVQYVTLGKVENEKVIFTYETADADPNTGHPARLVATSSGAYKTTDTNGNVYDESASAARAEIDYLNKKQVSDIAAARYTQVKADYDYALALSKARDELIEAAKTAKAAYDAVNDSSNGTAATQTTKRNAVKTAVETLASTDFTKLITPDPAINPTTTLDNDVRSAILAMDATTETRKNYGALVSAYNAMYDTSDSNSIVSKINTAIANLKDTSGTSYDEPSEVTAELVKLQQEISNLKNALNAYKIKVADLVTASTATGLDLSATADTIRNNVDALLAYTIDTTPLQNAVSEFTTAYNNNTTSGSNLTAAETAWQAKESAYNTAVGAAKSAYEAVVGAVGSAKDAVTIGSTTYRYTNNADKIVDVYSAARTDDGTAPTITDNNVECFATGSGTVYAKDYLYYAAIDPSKSANENPTLPGTADTKNDVNAQPTTATFTEFAVPGYTSGSASTVDALKTAKDTAENATNTAKKAADDARNSVAGTSAIKIYVNLVDGYDANWNMDQSTLGTEEVDFYLKKILAAGATSDQLIDSVKLADTVTAGAYKDMTFDLNVGLDSAQITYADDQKTITTEAVTANSEFKMKPTVDQSTKAVTWLNS